MHIFSHKDFFLNFSRFQFRPISTDLQRWRIFFRHFWRLFFFFLFTSLVHIICIIFPLFHFYPYFIFDHVYEFRVLGLFQSSIDFQFITRFINYAVSKSISSEATCPGVKHIHIFPFSAVLVLAQLNTVVDLCRTDFHYWI